MSAEAATPQVEGARARRLTELVFRIRELGILVALGLLIAVTAILEPRFIEANSLRNLALNAAIFAILAIGQTLVLVTRNVDLSVGSVLGLSAYLAGDLLSKHQGMPLPLVFILGMADRVLVMHEGRLTGELSRAEADEERVMRAATGQVEEAAA